MTTTPALGAAFVQVAQLLAAHLADHALPEPVSLEVSSGAKQLRVTAQVRSLTVREVAAEVLAWADTLTTVTVTVWRPPSGGRVHLSIASTLSGPAGPVELTVFGGADHDSALFGDLTPGEHRAATLGELRTGAANASHPRTGGDAVTR